MRNFFLALQIFAAFFLTVFGLAELFRSPYTSYQFVFALLASLGLTFLSLLAMNVKKMQG